MADNELEYAVKMLPIDETLQGAIDALKADGWELIPEVKPVAVYHIVRRVIREEPNNEVKVRMVIDDTKISILRNGKLVQE